MWLLRSLVAVSDDPDPKCERGKFGLHRKKFAAVFQKALLENGHDGEKENFNAHLQAPPDESPAWGMGGGAQNPPSFQPDMSHPTQLLRFLTREARPP